MRFYDTMLKNRYISIIVILFVTTLFAKAQTPFSMHGLGTLDDCTLGINSGMGGVGYGINNKMQINPKNPASYAAMDSLTFLFDIGMSVEVDWRKEGKLKETQTTANFDYAVAQFPIGKHLAASLGIVPFSRVNYEYGKKIPFGEYSNYGEGGIHQVYLGLAAKLYKNLFIGANVSYLFGNITHSSTIMPSSQYNVVAMIAQTKMHITDFKVDFGVRYTQPINDKHSITLGAVYSPKKKMLGKRYYDLYQLETSGETSLTVESDTMSLKGAYDMAESYGVGLGYNWEEKLIVGVDFTYQAWKNANYLPFWKKNYTEATLKNNFNNRYRISVGAEYKNELYSLKYVDRIRFRVGAYYEKSYMKIQGNGLYEAGATFGMGFPIMRDKSLVNVSVQYFNRKMQPNSKLVENGLIFSIGISFNEFWFFKNRIE